MTQENQARQMSSDLVLVSGGSFNMGDLFDEGRDNERPIHKVTLSDFYISKYEVTVGQFRKFVEQTGYRTSAEAPDDTSTRAEIVADMASGELSDQAMRDLTARIRELSGAGFWDADKHNWTGYNPETTWRNPGFKQSDNHPVLAVSVYDAMHFCNWMSKEAGLPVAYDLKTGEILDSNGTLTTDITTVRGYRLPTEAEWEYAAREGGQKVRFGNGKDVAKTSEINFCDATDYYDYSEGGNCVGSSTPVGNYPPNKSDLYDMSGNAWEWVSDKCAPYTDEPVTNPYATNARGHALRGGRWGGDASEARVSCRSGWAMNARCNNSGFRIARSAN